MMRKFIFILSIGLVNSIVFCQTVTSVYGLAIKTSPSSTFLGKIIPGTGVVTNISPASLGIAYVSSLATIDPKKNIYYYENGTNQFVALDIATGTIVSSPAITNPNATYFDLVAYNCLDSSIYGLARATLPTRLYLAKINPATGVANNISAASIGNGFVGTPSTLDPNTKRFYFEDGSFQFTSVDLLTGNIISAPLITYPNTNANLFDCFVYNCADSIIYGLARKNSPAQMYLSKINPVSGLVTFISGASINSNGQTSGGSTIDPINKIFYFQDGNQNLIGLSLITGNIVSNVPVTNANANSYTNFRSNTLCNCGGITTGIKSENINAGINVYPNPASGNLNVDLYLSSDKNINIEVADMYGRSLKKISESRFHSGQNSLPLDLSNYTSGIYFLRVSGEGIIYTKKIVLEY